MQALELQQGCIKLQILDASTVREGPEDRLKVDIDVIPRSRWWAEGGKYHDEMSKIDPYRDGCPPELLKRQAEQYAELFRIFHRHKEAIERISFWNLHNGQSWLNDFPWKRVNHPCSLIARANPKQPSMR